MGSGVHDVGSIGIDRYISALATPRVVVQHVQQLPGGWPLVAREVVVGRHRLVGVGDVVARRVDPHVVDPVERQLPQGDAECGEEPLDLTRLARHAGDEDDAVQIGLGWTHAGVETIDAQPFDVFDQTNGTATVKVSTAVAVLAGAQLGDFNNDSVVDDADINLLAQARRAGSLNPLFDVNADGSVDFNDTDHLVTVIIGTAFGDANLDFQVEDADLSLLLTNFGTL